MTIDGFLQFLGLAVAVYALFGVVFRYRLRLHGWLIWIPSFVALCTIVYLLMFDVVGAACSDSWCTLIQLPTGGEGLTPNKVAFLIVLAWLSYVVLLSSRTSISKRQIPLLSALVDRMVAEKRFPEIVDFIEPHIGLLSKCARREFPFQRLRDRARLHGNPFYEFGLEPKPDPTFFDRLKEKVFDQCLAILRPVLTGLPENSGHQEAALRVLLTLHTNELLVEFIALERPLFALKLMGTKTYDHQFGDRAFDLMMSQPQSQLRRETILNQQLDGCFLKIDPINPLIHKIFANANVAEELQVWRPVGNFPLRLLERDIEHYRNAISACKPSDDELMHRDPTYTMIRFFDIMVRSAMRDGLRSHMWLMYFDILVDKLLRFMDRDHPDYDPEQEFPNFGYYLIYEVFHTYGEWLAAIECCSEDSEAVKIESTEARFEGPGVVKWVMVSMTRSLRYLMLSRSDDRYVSYIIEVIMRDYKNLGRLHNGERYREALRNHLLAGSEYQPNDRYGNRFKRCYGQIDNCIRHDTADFEAALVAAYPGGDSLLNP
jgi:hypothetical protein